MKHTQEKNFVVKDSVLISYIIRVMRPHLCLPQLAMSTSSSFFSQLGLLLISLSSVSNEETENGLLCVTVGLGVDHSVVLMGVNPFPESVTALYGAAVLRMDGGAWVL